MDRREVLRYTALFSGAAVAAPLAGILLSGCATDEASLASDYIPQFLSRSEFDFLAKVVDVILPATDSPSATEVGVHQIIDHMVAKTYVAADQENFKTGFSALSQFLKDQGDQMGSAMRALELSEGSSDEELRNAFVNLKQQTIGYYLSTEKISKEYLNFLPVPGAYEACIDLSSVDNKLWAI